MAPNTSRVGPLKNPAGMTSVASYILVRAIQVKARREVVERFLRANRGTPQQGTQ